MGPGELMSNTAVRNCPQPWSQTIQRSIFRHSKLRECKPRALEVTFITGKLLTCLGSIVTQTSISPHFTKAGLGRLIGAN